MIPIELGDMELEALITVLDLAEQNALPKQLRDDEDLQQIASDQSDAILTVRSIIDDLKERIEAENRKKRAE